MKLLNKLKQYIPSNFARNNLLEIIISRNLIVFKWVIKKLSTSAIQAKYFPRLNYCRKKTFKWFEENSENGV